MSSSQRLHRSICVPFQEDEYTTILADRQAFRAYLQATYQNHPELFPDQMGQGFRFHGLVSYRKLYLDQRRIRLSNGHVYQIRPSFVMPYMIAKTDDIEKALYLRRFGVPFDALAYVFGRDAMFWYRATSSLGRNSLVGTTVKDPSRLPMWWPMRRTHVFRESASTSRRRWQAGALWALKSPNKRTPSRSPMHMASSSRRRLPLMLTTRRKRSPLMAG